MIVFCIKIKCKTVDVTTFYSCITFNSDISNEMQQWRTSMEPFESEVNNYDAELFSKNLRLLQSSQI